MSILAGVGLAVVGSALAAGIVRDRRNGKVRSEAHTGTRWILVPKSNHVFDPVEAEQWLNRLLQFRRPKKEIYTKGRVYFKLRIEKDQTGNVRFFFSAPDDRRIGVQQVLPDTLEWHKVKHSVSSANKLPAMWLGLEKSIMPLRRAEKRDHLITVLRALGPSMAIEITFEPADSKKWLRELQKQHSKVDPTMRKQDGGFGQEMAAIAKESALEISSAFAGKQRKTTAKSAGSKVSLLPHQAHEIKALRGRYSDIPNLMEVSVKLELLKAVKNPSAYFQSVLGALMDVADENRFVQERRPVSFPLSCAELATLVHIPSPEEWPDMPVIREHARTLEDHEFADGVAVGYLQHEIQQERLIRIPDSQFQRHFLLSGMTGAGKSSTLVFIIQSIIDRWVTSTDNKPQPGFTLMDPAEETTLIALSRLQAALPPESPLWEKVHYLSFSNTEYPVGLNMMQAIGLDGLLSLLQGAYGGGARIDRLIRNAVETLQGDRSVPHVLAGISPLLRNERWRMRVTKGIENVFLQQFWERDFASFEKNPDSFQPVENRLSPFISGNQKLYFGQPDFVLPIRKWMDEGHIFLVDVKALGNELMYLMVGSMIEHYHWTAQKRPPSTSLTHYLMIDECHRVQIPIMQNIIKEDRKYGLSLGLITQSVEQFQTDLKREIKDNLGTIITLRQGLEGSKTTAELSNGHFDGKTLRSLDDFVSAVYTRIGGKAQSLETKAPPPVLMKGFKDDAVEVDFRDHRATNARYDMLRAAGADFQKKIGRPKNEVERSLNFYLNQGYWPADDEAQKKALPKYRESAEDLV